MFEKPYYLLATWFIPAIGLLYLYSYRRRRRAARSLFGPAMQATLLPRFHWKREIGLPCLVMLSFFCVAIALAEPRFGTNFEESSIRGADVFVLLDVSRSMLAEDLAPNRLTRAKSDIRDLLEHIQGARVGLIVFAGKPMIRAPLTNDHGFFLDTLLKVDTNSAPRGGTAIGDAIRTALTAMPFDVSRDQSMIVITDGEDQDSFPIEAAKEATAQGIRVILVGLGDPNTGARIPIMDENGKRTYLQFENQDVWTKLDEKQLVDIARECGGVYVPAATKMYDLGHVYVHQLFSHRNANVEETVERKKTPRKQFQVFLAIGFALLFAAGIIREYD